MKKFQSFLQFMLIFAALAWCVPANAWTDQLHPVTTTATSGTTPRVTASPTAGWGLIIVAGNQNQTSGGSTSCCNAGCTATWTKIAGTTNATRGTIEVWGCTNAATGTSLSIGPTWSSSCSAGPTCFTRFVAASASGTINAIVTATDGCTTSGTSANPVECSPSNASTSTFTGAGLMFATTATACSNTYTCTFPNGNGEGYKITTSYVPTTWTGVSGAYIEAVGFLTETVAGGTTYTPQMMMTGAGD